MFGFGVKDEFDELSEKIGKDIDENNPKIEKWLKDNGYNIIGKDTRIFWYSYKVIKGNQLETKKEFTFEEMKNIIGITTN